MALRLKLVPDDPRHAEYRDIHKTPDGLIKTDLSMQIRKILEDNSLSDDVKMKMYRQTLDRFLNVTDTVPGIDTCSATNTLSSINCPSATKERKRKIKSPTVRRSTRKRKTSTKWLAF
jgi:hypothetical protein